MARSRSVPTNLLRQPAFFELGSDDQIVLIDLILDADDYGRGLAHFGFLARTFNKTQHVIEEAFQHLSAVQLLTQYEVEGNCYYSLTRWEEWETLSRRTPSIYPAPPCDKQQESPEKCRKAQKYSENCQHVHAEEEEEYKQEEEDEDDGVLPDTTLHPSPGSDDDDERLRITVQDVAAILKIGVTPALTRLVQEYLPDTQIALLGEADAAREWIDDRRRNRAGKRMTPAFFRRWLQREQHTLRRLHEQELAGASTTPGQAHADHQAASPAVELSGQSLMGLENAYKRFRREKERV